MWIICLVNDADQHTVSTWNEVPHLPLWQLTEDVYQMINLFNATSKIYGEQLRTVNTESVIPESCKKYGSQNKMVAVNISANHGSPLLLRLYVS